MSLRVLDGLVQHRQAKPQARAVAVWTRFNTDAMVQVNSADGAFEQALAYPVTNLLSMLRKSLIGVGCVSDRI